MPVKPIPDGYHSITPYLIVQGAAQALEFYRKAFDATEVLKLTARDKVAHAEIKIGNSIVMLADEAPDYLAYSPGHYGGSPVTLMIYVENVDRQFLQAIAAGATELRPVKNQFYGDRSGTLKDPFGHTWTLSTHVEDLTQEEIDKRFAAMMLGG